MENILWDSKMYSYPSSLTWFENSVEQQKSKCGASGHLCDKIGRDVWTHLRLL